MGGGAKQRRQEESERQSREATNLERQRATELNTELTRRREIVGRGVPETLAAAQTGAQNLRDTGGFGPEIDAISGGYKNFAETGGFDPVQKESFLRKATAPVAAIYNRTKDELKRRMALQGGYMPGFDSSAAKITRHAAIEGSNAALGANVELANQVRSGKALGLQGQQSIAEAQQRGRIAGQDALQRVSQFGVSALSDVDITDLRNRLQTGQMSQNDAQLLAMLAAQDKTMFEKVMQGISTVGGATAGILGAV